MPRVLYSTTQHSSTRFLGKLAGLNKPLSADYIRAIDKCVIIRCVLLAYFY